MLHIHNTPSSYETTSLTKKKPRVMMAIKTSVTHNKALMTTVRGYRAFSNLMLVFVT